MSYERFDAEERILRDELALDRTRLANERTVLAYLRTGLMLLATGATAVKLAYNDPTFVFAGWGFIVLGTAVAFLGVWRFVKMHRMLEKVAKREAALEKEVERAANVDLTNERG